MRRAGRGLFPAVALSLFGMAVGLAGTAVAAPPHVTITSPTNGSESQSARPSFSGLAEAGGDEVTFRIYEGPPAEGAPIRESSTPVSAGGTWSLEPAKPLTNGTYTAQATQTNAALETGTSSPVVFTVDTPAPTVTLNSPESPSNNKTPSFTGTASGKKPVIVQIHTGATEKGAVVSTATAEGTGGGWTSGNASPALSSGQYTAVATQASSLAGNPAGESGAVTFTVSPAPAITPLAVIAPAALPPLAAPVASFRWFPSVPETGETVSLVSTASDSTSGITGIAWSLTGSGPFQAGGAVLTTAFSAPGGHLVRLLVTNAYGLSSVATETINAVGRTVSLMQPYPVVRIAGYETASGIKLRLLQVQQLPAGARITVSCRGRGCPIKSVRRVALSRKQQVGAVEFRAFERALRFGVTLEIRVSVPGEIGKYTRFAIRRGKLPQRLDMCLDAAGVKPLVCPSS